MKKITAKQKPAKGKPREWVRWAIVEEDARLWTVFETRASAIKCSDPSDEFIRVRITEIVK